MKNNVKITGLDSLKRKADKFHVNLETAIEEGLEEIGERIRKEARKNTGKGKYLGLVKRYKKDNLPKGIKKGAKAYTDSGKVKRSKPLRKGGVLKESWEKSEVIKKGKVFSVKIFNPIFYAHWYEYGHKSRSGSWIRGRFPLRRAVKQIEPKKYSIMRKHLNKLIKEFGYTTNNAKSNFKNSFNFSKKNNGFNLKKTINDIKKVQKFVKGDIGFKKYIKLPNLKGKFKPSIKRPRAVTKALNSTRKANKIIRS